MNWRKIFTRSLIPRVNKNHARILIYGFVGLFVLIAAGWFYVLKPWEPQYGGKPMSYWLACLRDPDRSNKSWISQLLQIEPPEPGTEIEALKRIGAPAIPGLIAALDDENPDVQRIAIGLLEGNGREAEKCVPKLVVLLNDDHPFIRAAAAYAFVRIGGDPEKVVPALIPLLKDKNKNVRASAIDPLRTFGSKAREAAPHLIALVDDKQAHWLDRLSALGALGEIAESKIVIPVLIRHAGNKKLVLGYADVARNVGPDSKTLVPLLIPHLADKSTRWQAVEALAVIGIGAKKAVPNLLPLLEDPDAEMQARAAAALQKIGCNTDRIVPVLINLLKDPKGHVRVWAVRTLRDIGPAAKDALVGLQAVANDDTDEYVRQEANNAIRAIKSKANKN